MTKPTPREQFTAAITRPEREVHLAQVCFLVAAEEYPELDPLPYLDAISEFADRVRGVVGGEMGAYDVVYAINNVLFGKGSLRGNTENYYDPRNSLLNDVFDRRLGIPISLSIIYLEVAREAGFPMDGIGMPGHFLVGAGEGEGRIFVDPYNSGGLLSRKECLAMALRGRVPRGRKPDELAKHLLPVSSKKAIVHRLLNNLKLAYVRGHEYSKALSACERIQLVAPDNWRNLSELARLQAEVGRYTDAADTLTEYLERVPEGTDTRLAENALRQLRDFTGRTGGAGGRA